MFVFRQLTIALANLVSTALWIYMWIIIIRALISWINPDPYNPIVRFLHQVTEPVLRPVRAWLPTWQLGIDLSPMVVILIIYFLQQFLVPVLHEMARMMG
ncbi:MAG: YggT family protein [Candidatus Methylomirabilia bacterium]